MIRLLSATLAIGLLLTTAAIAGPIDDVVEQAKALAGKANGQEQTSPAVAAIDAARAATMKASSDAPLGFRRILFVTAEPEGFAMTRARAMCSRPASR
jgi:hypothetical protein